MPDHDDKNPSCVLYPDHFFCFSCNKGGNTYELVKIVKGLTFIEACDYLNKLGIEAQHSYYKQHTTSLKEKMPNSIDKIETSKEASKLYLSQCEKDAQAPISYFKMRCGAIPQKKYIRFHPKDYAIACIIVDPITMRGIGIHRLMLDKKGNDLIKVNGKRLKMTLGSSTIKGGVFIAYESDLSTNINENFWVISEGIENAVALKRIFKDGMSLGFVVGSPFEHTYWRNITFASTITASNAMSIQLPTDAHILFFCDLDNAGRDAAYNFKKKNPQTIIIDNYSIDGHDPLDLMKILYSRI